jgi:hypothetical protein
MEFMKRGSPKRKRRISYRTPSRFFYQQYQKIVKWKARGKKKK